MDTLKDLELISQAAGVRVDYTQGGGGNTSAKLDDTRMAVKASGFQLKQITPKTGFVVVNYKNIKAYHEGVDISVEKDYEKESSQTTNDNILDYEDLPRLRPSVEAGFHSILKKFVIHTHSVYANILTCSNEGHKKADEIFGSLNYKYIWMPYIDPGFRLTIEMLRMSKELGATPDIIFMENHGLIVTSDDAAACVTLHDDVNNIIREKLGLTAAFPEVTVTPVSEGVYKSGTVYLQEYVKANKVTAQLFSDIILYPDQLVYLNGSADKMDINNETGEITYTTVQKEAQTIEETLAAYIFVIDKIKQLGMNIHTMGEAGVNFINNWESEKYRKSLAK